MANTLTFFRPVSVLASASSSRKPEPDGRKAVSSRWWSPVFGWASDPDYINPTADSSQSGAVFSDQDPEPGRARSRFTLGCFTEDKAKQLRKKTMESSAFHDIMYHSAIASRLASDLSDWPEK